ncbi:MAG: HU family DNA-binding protein [Clostridiales bacterium]|jgi:DNA-binding protein HU-beta|nr:HU family DNA-binding protein [Clostridiales bacterium]
MNKPQLIDCIAKKGNISKVEAKKALELTIEAISEALAKGESITLIGFGTFKITELAGRTGRNPQTGKTMQIKPKKVVRFKAGNELASKVK